MIHPILSDDNIIVETDREHRMVVSLDPRRSKMRFDRQSAVQFARALSEVIQEWQESAVFREDVPDPQVRRDFPDGYVESTDDEVLECVRITKGSATFLLHTGPACELLYKVNLYLLGQI